MEFPKQLTDPTPTELADAEERVSGVRRFIPTCVGTEVALCGPAVGAMPFARGVCGAGRRVGLLRHTDPEGS